MNMYLDKDKYINVEINYVQVKFNIWIRYSIEYLGFVIFEILSLTTIFNDKIYHSVFKKYML